MKKIIFIFLISFLSFTIGTVTFAKTVKSVKKVTVVKKVVKKSIKTPTNFIEGTVSGVDYDAKTFVLNTKNDSFTVIDKNNNVHVPGVRKVVNIENIADEMIVKVWGALDKENKTITAKTITVMYTHMASY